MKLFLLSTLSLGLASCARSQPAPTAKPLQLHTLIVSGGPSIDYNQYAIESNARYVEKLTAGSTARRILFADGSKTSRTISTIRKLPDQDAQEVFAWLFDLEAPDERTVLKASTLGHIDGPSTKKSVLQNVAWLAAQAKTGEKSLLYFTGHGSPGTKRTLALFKPQWSEDFENTTYALWGDDNLAVHELAAPLQNWPQKTPLVVVMVQCHAGGFANLLFEGGDPQKPLLDRDFCGFFAATGDRQASGCTPEVDETDYQDFTTRFFAALSGVTRDGKKVSGMDYDHSGSVSLLEALAWTDVTDMSIDVPECTSDAYLRVVFPPSADQAWSKTPYSTLLKTAAPWQKAMLNGFSTQLHLTGEGRIEVALKKDKEYLSASESETGGFPKSLNEKTVYARYNQLKAELRRRFPGLKSSSTSARFKRATPAALRYLGRRKVDLTSLASASRMWNQEADSASTREAQTWRFVRATRTLYLEGKLQREGTAAQKAAFARLRVSESRNPLL
jgi:hypothetical protein